MFEEKTSIACLTISQEMFEFKRKMEISQKRDWSGAKVRIPSGKAWKPTQKILTKRCANVGRASRKRETTRYVSKTGV